MMNWKYDSKRTRVMSEDSEYLIADIRGWGKLQCLPNGEEIQDYNGRLIAAAPELLDLVLSYNLKTKSGASCADLSPIFAELMSKITVPC